MILIITNNSDQVTSRICMWLLHYHEAFRIISIEDRIKVLKIDSNTTLLENLTREYTIDLATIKKVLYRQGDLVLTHTGEKQDMNLSNFLRRERKVLHEFLYHKLEEAEHYGHPQQADLNKLVMLEKAIGAGLLVPEYLFTGSKKDLLEFSSLHPELISKIILPGYRYEKDNSIYTSYTELVSTEEVDEFSETFHPTFFQKFVYKKFDIRMFYINKEFFSTAIISQNNQQTKVDCRVYGTELRSRNVAFKVPSDIEKKMRKLILSLGLKYCSVDLVYGQDEKFYFLEINPIGQFGNVSYSGNYHLEKKIADLLCA